jgi:translocation and assembly module TamB
LQGKAFEELQLKGRLHLDRADINIAENLPHDVAVLDVRRPGQQAPPPQSAARLVLDVAVDAPRQVYVRGHGLNAEMGGHLEVHGPSDQPAVAGGFELRNGQVTLAGQTLDLTAGKVTFDGVSLTKRLDPVIDFTGQKSAVDVTAYLQVTGYADAPKIKISSTPDMPQDEVLARLLFGQSVTQLSPFQMAAIAQAVASISGVGSGGDPLGAVRNGLGLDRLTATSVSDTTGDTTTIEAGKYVANGVYVGTKQGTEGGTQAHVQIDLTRHLKLETTVGTGTGVATKNTAPENDPGSSVGLTYQFDY